MSAELVVLGHASVLALPETLAVRGPNGYLAARPGFHVQSYGVVIFLVLSGYLISMSVRRRLDDPDHTFGRYMIDRAARILTPLVPAIAFVFVVDHLVFRASTRSEFVPLHYDMTTVVSNVFFLQDNLVMHWLARHTGLPLAARSLGSAAPWWTVALEWWIYVAFGIVAIALLKRSGGWRYTVALLPVLAFSLATVGATVVAGSGLALAWVVGFAYAWFAGTLRTVPRTAHKVLLALAGGYLIVAFGVWSLPVYDPLCDVVTAVAVLSGFHAFSWEELLQPCQRFLTFASNVSYSIYLIHFSVMAWLVALMPDRVSEWWRLAILVVCGNLAGVAWWWLFERHFPFIRDWSRRRLLRPPRSERKVPATASR